MMDHVEEAIIDAYGPRGECDCDTCSKTWGEFDATRKEIADLKDSNARLADALAAAKERAGDTYGP